MHIYVDLLARECVLLVVLVALGAGPAVLLSERIDAASRAALAPILGFALGTCFATTVLEFASADRTYWLLILLALASLIFAGWRMLRQDDVVHRSFHLSLRDVAQLLVVCIAVAGPLTYTFHTRHTVGPVAYTYTDVDNYIGEQDGARTTSIGDARQAWSHAQRTNTRFADLTQWDWAFFASFNANPNMAAVSADLNSLLGLGATDTNSPFLIVLLLAGAFGAFAAVRYFTCSNTWMAALAGALFGGPMFLELWFDGFEAAIMALGLVMPFVILGVELLRSPGRTSISLLALVAACLLIVYPVYVPVFSVMGAIFVIYYIATHAGRANLWSTVFKAATAIAGLLILVIIFANIGFIHNLEYFQKLANNEVPLPRVAFHLPVQVLPGWLLQTREFWYLPTLSSGDAKQILLAALLPLVFLGFIVFGLRRHRLASVLVALGGICSLAAVYAYTSRDHCTYCAERELLPLAPIVAVLVAVGLAAVLAIPRRWARLLGVVGATLLVVAVAQRTRIELTRFADGAYFLDSANRSVLTHLPHGAKAIQLEGYGQALSGQAEQPLWSSPALMDTGDYTIMAFA